MPWGGGNSGLKLIKKNQFYLIFPIASLPLFSSTAIALASSATTTPHLMTNNDTLSLQTHVLEGENDNYHKLLPFHYKLFFLHHNNPATNTSSSVVSHQHFHLPHAIPVTAAVIFVSWELFFFPLPFACRMWNNSRLATVGFY
jgi:hypothetical protein